MKNFKDFTKAMRQDQLFINSQLRSVRGGLDNNTEKTTYRTGPDKTDFDSGLTCDACKDGVSAHQDMFPAE